MDNGEIRGFYRCGVVSESVRAYAYLIRKVHKPLRDPV